MPRRIIEWQALKDRSINYIANSEPPTKLVFPGTFQPLHKGHLNIQKIAEETIGIPITFEISIFNIEKASLSYSEIEKILDQFRSGQNWVLTNAPRFDEKAAIFKQSTFILGMDTLLRLFDPKFYGSDQAMQSRLQVLIENDMRFMVFGRRIESHFMTLNDFLLPEAFKDRFIGISETEFREDISSSEIKIERLREMNDKAT